MLEREDIERLVGRYKADSQPAEPKPLAEELEPGPAEIAAAEVPGSGGRAPEDTYS